MRPRLPAHISHPTYTPPTTPCDRYYYLDDGHGYELKEAMSGFKGINNGGGSVIFDDTGTSVADNVGVDHKPNWVDDDVFGRVIQCGDIQRDAEGNITTILKDTLSLSDIDYGHSGSWSMSVWIRHEPDNFPGYSREQFLGHGNPNDYTGARQQLHLQLEPLDYTRDPPRLGVIKTILFDNSDIDRYVGSNETMLREIFDDGEMTTLFPNGVRADCYDDRDCRAPFGKSTSTGPLEESHNGMWHHLVLSTHPDGSKGYTLYVDGVEKSVEPADPDAVATPEMINVATGGRPTNPEGPIRLCGRATPGDWAGLMPGEVPGLAAGAIWSASRFFHGRVAHFAVWDMAMTASQVADLNAKYRAMYQIDAIESSRLHHVPPSPPVPAACANTCGSGTCADVQHLPCSALTLIGCSSCAGCCSDKPATVTCGENLEWSETDAACKISCDAGRRLGSESVDDKKNENQQLFGLPAPLNEGVGVGTAPIPHHLDRRRAVACQNQVIASVCGTTSTPPPPPPSPPPPPPPLPPSPSPPPPSPSPSPPLPSPSPPPSPTVTTEFTATGSVSSKNVAQIETALAALAAGVDGVDSDDVTVTATYVVTLAATIAATIETFDKEAYKAKIVGLACDSGSCTTNDVTLTVTTGSVVATATVKMPDAQKAAKASQALTFDNKDAAKAALGVEVDEVPTVTQKTEIVVTITAADEAAATKADAALDPHFDDADSATQFLSDAGVTVETIDKAPTVVRGGQEQNQDIDSSALSDGELIAAIIVPIIVVLLICLGLIVFCVRKSKTANTTVKMPQPTAQSTKDEQI